MSEMNSNDYSWTRILSAIRQEHLNLPTRIVDQEINASVILEENMVIKEMHLVIVVSVQHSTGA